MIHDHVSPSQLDTFTRCPRQWMYRYAEGIKAPPRAAMITGKAGHKAAEHTLKAKLAGKSATMDEVSTIAAETVNAAWDAEPPMLDEDEKDAGVTATRGAAVDNAVAASRHHLTVIAPSIEPVFVEHEFRIEIGGLPPVVGFTDVETATEIRDLKIGRKAKSQADADGSAQLTIYAMASSIAGTRKTVAYDSIVLGKKGPSWTPISSSRDETDFGRVLDRLSLMERTIQAGIFAPADPSSWACSPKWCGYWEICPHGGRREVLVQIRNRP